ncbi:cupin domain-containing protein [Pseudoroseicyclus tamaricis]|uniref:Cupin domain-containing protein n=1 Tax=Pseudoroseicyclus tamaricis TaxID=2705421 RepID=A0A6B2JKL4_9RHOB|nr:cupin domain-containing protein [Pseudoroseicyclus tamaricis]NDV02041.1 cupin domain-containing protein [Pseudoroseicyclus tamaricis]
MIFKAGSVAPQRVEGSATRQEVRLGDAGGLAQLGVNIVTLGPGERSAMRHWHAQEDEFLYLLSGEAVVVEDDGEHVLRPGDACCWPAGVENAHHVLNRSDAPLTYLVVGSQAEIDTVRYPDDGLTLHQAPPRWQMLRDDGTVAREGDT